MKYIDRTFIINPLTVYLNWLLKKSYYQLKYWGKHLRIGYNSKVSGCSFSTYNWIGTDVNLSNCNVGRYTYIQSRSTINNCKIGAFCSIGSNVTIAPGKHPTDTFVSTHPSFFSRPGNLLDNFVDQDVFKNFDNVVIGNDVWIGSNVLIVDGVTINDGAIIAANAVVNKDVEAYAIVGGVPAKHLKYRFSAPQVEQLLRFRWWDRDIHWIKNNITSFWSIDEFIKNTHEHTE
jgi:acetyltransferase-like isoleucine patch superfamily enzyme